MNNARLGYMTTVEVSLVSRGALELVAQDYGLVPLLGARKEMDSLGKQVQRSVHSGIR